MQLVNIYNVYRTWPAFVVIQTDTEAILELSLEELQAGQYEDGIAANSSWATGDWNGDAELESGDLVLAFQAGGYELGPRAATAGVPEPSAWMLWCAALPALGLHRRARALR